ncbi:peptidyl-prolyl cis-trans isomerase [Aurantimonas sp. VKM B-3413]|uniref:peptidyl-prolyl cis-trans isomerase n=1 Tax=Aurantimonas sp. VKM B-3413 TaxID=2779401 RepID=UPI001E508C1B|nr:peptidyl-prolyl cis-trans isomerase [Aurantimonas sp. VKM B-3413]MCB8838555.1 peptidyl-prolyl cis-trans isomerase [Aurantimonas sp. VKM B-3413]
MLDMLRRSVTGWTAKILMSLLVLSFVVWGIGGAINGGSVGAVLSAGETAVTPQDYALAYSRAEARIAQQIGRRPSAQEAQMFGLDQSVLSQLMAGAVLDEQARRIGLGMSEDELAKQIASDPTFHDSNGTFSRTAFRNILANARISEEQYITSQAQSARRTQLLEAVSTGADAPKTFETALGLYNGERRTIDYFTLTAAALPPVADPDEKALQTYFDAHKDNYAAPEYRSIAYADLSPQAISDPSTISEDQIAADYEAHKDLYTTPERRRVQQIVFSDTDAAQAAKAKLDAGESFEQVAKDNGKSLADTELGLLSRTQIPDDKLAEAAFSLEKDGISDVVQGAFGPAILHVTEIEPAGVKPLPEVSDDIRKQLALANAADAVNTAYDTFEDARAGGATFMESAKNAAIPVKTVAAVDSQGNGPDGKPVDLPAGKDLLEQAFQTEPGFDNVPVNQGSNGYVFYDVVSVDPAHARTLDEVKDKVVADWKEEQTRDALQKKAEALKAEVEKGKSIADAAREVGGEPKTAASVTRQSGLSELGQSGIAAAFSGPRGTVAATPASNSDSRLILKVAEVSPPADPQSNVGTQERQQMSAMLENDLVQSYVTLLQNQYPVSVNPAAIDQAKAMVR